MSSGTAEPPCDRTIMRVFMSKPGFLLGRIDQICTAVFTHSQDHVTLSQAEFLLLLERLGPMIQIALARAAGVDKSTTAYVLDNLQARGLIARSVPAGDRRSSLVSLTAAGRAALPGISRAFGALQQKLESPICGADRARLAASLRRLAQEGGGLAPAWRAACEPSTGVLDNAISFLARRALQLLNAQFYAMTRGMGLTPRQFSLLFILSRRRWITQAEFATMFGLDAATCAVIMRSLARRGLLTGARSEHDRRALVYRLTPEGEEALAEVHRLMDRSEWLVLRQQDPAERARLVEHLRTIVVTHSHALRHPGLLTG